MSTVKIQRLADEEIANARISLQEELERRMQAVQCRAYELYEQRGREPGHELEDWLQAEQEVLGWPAAEVKEEGETYNFRVALPGFDPKSMEVLASPHEIVVHAARNHRNGESLDSEDSEDVYRRFEVPQPIDPERLRAKFGRGTLRIKATKVFNSGLDGAPA